MRSRLLLVSAALIAAFLLGAQLALVPAIERALLANREGELSRLAIAAREAREMSSEAGAESSQAVAHRLAAAFGTSVEFLSPSDPRASVLDPDSAAGTTRASQSRVHIERDKGGALQEMVLVLPPSGTPPLATRVTLNLVTVASTVTELQRYLVLAALLGLLIAAALSKLAASLVAAPVNEMTAVALELGALRFQRRLRPGGSDVIADLGRALDGLADRLETTLTDLTRERDLLGAVLEGMADGVLVTDASGRIVRTNPALRALLPREPVEQGRTVLEATRHPALVEHIRRVLATRQPREQEIELAGPPARAFRVNSAPVLEPPGAVTVFHEVTELRRLERIRRDFVANVSHELRTPVAAVQAAGETLLNGGLADDKRAAEFVAIMARNAERLGALVTDLLALARLESGELHFNVERVRLATIVDDVLATVRERMRDKSLVATSLVAADIEIEADGRALHQVLANLIENAVKYTPAGGQLGIEATTDDRHLRLVVWDNGLGIESQHRERVFERFYRVDKGRSREMGGTGLGLAIVRHMVEAMAGRVYVEDHTARGTRMVVELPLRRTVLFACVHNAGRSQMAAALFNAVADPRAAHATSAGTAPAERVHPAVVESMREVGIELGGERPRMLTAGLSERASLLITMGCGEQCPVIPGVERADWPLPDPAGQPLEQVRAIRDSIRERVEQLVRERHWAREGGNGS